MFQCLPQNIVQEDELRLCKTNSTLLSLDLHFDFPHGFFLVPYSCFEEGSLWDIQNSEEGSFRCPWESTWKYLELLVLCPVSIGLCYF